MVLVTAFLRAGAVACSCRPEFVGRCRYIFVHLFVHVCMYMYCVVLMSVGGGVGVGGGVNERMAGIWHGACMSMACTVLWSSQLVWLST